MLSYTLAIPFLKYTLFGDLFFAFVFVGWKTRLNARTRTPVQHHFITHLDCRNTGADFFHPGKTRPDAAVTLTRMINTLPAAMSGGIDPRAVDPFKRAALWSSVAESGALTGLSDAGIARARSELDRCGQYAEMGFKLTLRGCLESAHDRTMREVNDELWKAEVGY